MNASPGRLSLGELHELTRWNTPTIYNGWELFTRHNPARDGINHEPLHDYMPQMGAMAGYAVTVVIEPSNPEHPRKNPGAWAEYRRYVGSVEGPKIVVVQDLDKPRTVGAFWGEVNSNSHKALGCIGTITDGAIRDVNEMTAAGFKALARRLCVGHAFNSPVRWNCEVDVFGQKIVPGQLIHADFHGFLAVPPGEEAGLLEAARFADSVECQTKIAASKGAGGKTTEEIVAGFVRGGSAYKAAIEGKYGRRGET